MANAMVEELKKLTTGMSMTGAVNSKGFLEERIAKAKDELVQAEDSLKAYQSKYKTIDATQQATLSASATAQLAAQLTSQEIQLSVLRRTYADSSQAVKALQQSISVLKEKIDRLQAGGGSVALPGFEKIPERGQEFLHLMRRFKTAEAVNEMLAKQYEVAKLNAENDISSIQVIQQALVPEKKSKPARTVLVLTSMSVALLFSLLLAFALENVARMPDEERARWKALLTH
jgi:capsule polysaccharide export protein KpsE/RkpR